LFYYLFVKYFFLVCVYCAAVILFYCCVLYVGFWTRCTCCRVPRRWRGLWRIRDRIFCLRSQDCPARCSSVDHHSLARRSFPSVWQTRFRMPRCIQYSLVVNLFEITHLFKMLTVFLQTFVRGLFYCLYERGCVVGSVHLCAW